MLGGDVSDGLFGSTVDKMGGDDDGDDDDNDGDVGNVGVVGVDDLGDGDGDGESFSEVGGGGGGGEEGSGGNAFSEINGVDEGVVAVSSSAEIS